MQPASRLLVVDDEFNNRDMLSRRLVRRGYQVDVADGGKEALERINSAHYDLILLDQMMPGMSGLDLLQLLRATYSASELPVIMVTAVDQSQAIVDALNQGANDYVVKPVDLPVVAARIEAQLSRSSAERRLRESEERYSLAARGSNDGLWDWHLGTGAIYFSTRWLSLLGYSEGDFDATPEAWLSKVHPDDQPRLRAEIQSHLDGASPELRSEHRIRQKNQEYRWVLCRGIVHRNTAGLALRFAGSMTDIEHSKVSDPLTGLCNRMLLSDRMLAAVIRPGARLAVLLLDLDGFKMVNDSFGHAAGDQLLVEVAARLRNLVTAPLVEGPATIARLGGDEFAILLEQVDSEERVTLLAGRILAHLNTAISLQGLPVTISASIGGVLSDGAAAPGQLLRQADLAMYRAKELGKNRWQLFNPDLQERAEERMSLAIDLRKAIERGQLLAVYQPKVNMRTRQIVGFEALLRWRHPRHGIISPVKFIPIAEETGLIVPIGEWILEAAARQLRIWQGRFPCHPPLSMNVNLSVKQLGDPNLLPRIRAVIAETGIAPETLKLELTESALMTDTESTHAILAEIQAMKIGLKLDDFGTGYSSLSNLKALNFESLKIDRSFIERVALDPESHAIVQTIVDLARTLHMGVVAEGVEDEDQMNELVKMGCDIAQGFYFSKPVEAAAAEALLVSSITAALTLVG
jgi:diguanylate cyclase (GGDEF)-like protein/PAS domain S-box-containing protein